MAAPWYAVQVCRQCCLCTLESECLCKIHKMCNMAISHNYDLHVLCVPMRDKKIYTPKDRPTSGFLYPLPTKHPLGAWSLRTNAGLNKRLSSGTAGRARTAEPRSGWAAERLISEMVYNDGNLDCIQYEDDFYCRCWIVLCFALSTESRVHTDGWGGGVYILSIFRKFVTLLWD